MRIIRTLAATSALCLALPPLAAFGQSPFPRDARPSHMRPVEDAGPRAGRPPRDRARRPAPAERYELAPRRDWERDRFGRIARPSPRRCGMDRPRPRASAYCSRPCRDYRGQEYCEQWTLIR